MRHFGLFINGEWCRPQGAQSLTVRDKFSDEVLADLPVARPSDVNQATSAAMKAFETRILSPTERYEILMTTGTLMRAHTAELATLLVKEVGKTIREARSEVHNAISAVINAAEEAKRIHGETVPIEANLGAENKLAFTIREPSGPVCAITPFNAPLNVGAHKVASAIAAGNSVVIKPSEFTPLSTARLAEIMNAAGLPAGYLNVVFGGPDVGEQLCLDERFARYSFTGGQAAGRRILANIGLRPATLELGSNAPTFVHEDADLELASQRCLQGAFAIAGQVCTSVQRLFVHEKIYRVFVDRLLELIDAMVLGDPADEATDMGPMLTLEAAKRAEHWVLEAVAGGAKILTGGHRDGRLFAPTVLTNVTLEMRVVCQEVFAPVVCILPYQTLEEAVAVANKAQGGLQAGIFTQNLNVAFTFARKIRAGGVMVNETSRFRVANMPYGGVGSSGLGREGPMYAIQELTDLKTIIFHL